MSRQQSSTDADWQNVQRRRGVRIVLSLPVKVAWVTKEGKRVSRHAETEVVSAYGATLWMKTPPPTSTEIELTHGRTRKSVRARVLRAHPPEKNQTPRIAVELKAPSESFWGDELPTRESLLGVAPTGACHSRRGYRFAGTE